MALNFANNNSLSAITSLPASISSGSMTLIQEQTASSSSTISFTSGIDSTYDEYVFKFYDIHPASNDVAFQFQVNASGQTGFNETITSTTFDAYHAESGGAAALRYLTGADQAQGTSYQNLINCTNGNDESAAGYLHLFNPSSTTFVKHFIARVCSTQQSYANEQYTAGYINTTSAIDEASFKMASGYIDSGTIKLYGIKDS